MVSYYATEAELEGLTGKAFTSSSPVTSTQVVLILTQMSARLDGLLGLAEQTHGDDSACDEWTKQAVLAAADYYTHKRWIGEEPDQVMINTIIQSFFTNVDTERATRVKYYQDRPTASGDW